MKKFGKSIGVEVPLLKTESNLQRLIRMKNEEQTYENENFLYIKRLFEF